MCTPTGETTYSGEAGTFTIGNVYCVKRLTAPPPSDAGLRRSLLQDSTYDYPYDDDEEESSPAPSTNLYDIADTAAVELVAADSRGTVWEDVLSNVIKPLPPAVAQKRAQAIDLTDPRVEEFPKPAELGSTGGSITSPQRPGAAAASFNPYAPATTPESLCVSGGNKVVVTVPFIFEPFYEGQVGGWVRC